VTPPRRVLAATLALSAAAAALASSAHAESARVRDIVVECAQCHGADRISIRAGAPDLAGRPEDALMTQLRAFRAGRRAQHPEMRKMSRELTRRELRAIARHYARMPAQ
jgi:cytochrome c553